MISSQMLYSQLFSALALLTLTGAASVPQPKVLALEVNRSNKNASLPLRSNRFNGRTKRSDQVVLENEQGYYSTDLQLGSQKTTVSFLVDTGSSDLWVSNSAFKTSKSSTWDNLGTPFSISYGDGSTASGTFGKDTVILGSATISQAEFAVTTSNSGDDVYVFGIGYPAGEATVTLHSDGSETGEYNNIPVSLKQQGYTESNSYSLWLNTYLDSTGQILFGGIDHTKYTGTLGKVPIVTLPAQYDYWGDFATPDTPQRLSIILNDIALTNGNGDSGDVVTGAAVPVLLDSGTTLTYLPEDWLEAIANTIGATYDNNAGAWVTTLKQGSIDYNFSGVEVSVPFQSFLRALTNNDGSPYTNSNGQQLYALGIAKEYPAGIDYSSGDIYILGDTFLEGAYVVYDLDTNEIALAEAVYGEVSDSDIEAIGNGIPAATAAPSYSATQSSTDYTLHTPAGLF